MRSRKARLQHVELGECNMLGCFRMSKAPVALTAKQVCVNVHHMFFWWPAVVKYVVIIHTTMNGERDIEASHKKWHSAI